MYWFLLSFMKIIEINQSKGKFMQPLLIQKKNGTHFQSSDFDLWLLQDINPGRDIYMILRKKYIYLYMKLFKKLMFKF